MTNLSYIRSLNRRLDDMSRREIENIVDKIGNVCPNHGRPHVCRDCGSCYETFLNEEYVEGEYSGFYSALWVYIKIHFEKEPVKENFTWDDMFDKNKIIPCDYCDAVNRFPVCDDGATSSACNHCEYNIYRHIDFEVK